MVPTYESALTAKQSPVLPTAVGTVLDAYGGPVVALVTSWSGAVAALSSYLLAQPGLITVVPVEGGAFTGSLVVSRANLSLETYGPTRPIAADAARLGTDVGFMFEALALLHLPSAAAQVAGP
jgi:hypothetical protein